MPTETELFRWWVTDEVTRRRRKTSFRMDRATAAERYPDAEPDLSSRELRTTYAPGKEIPPYCRQGPA